MKKYIKKLFPKLFIRVTFHIIYIVSIASLPFIIKNMIDDNYADNLMKIVVHIIAFIGMIIVGMWAQYVSQKTAWEIEYDLNCMLRANLFRTFVDKEPAEFSKRNIGEYTSMLENDVSAVAEYFEYCIDVIENVLSLIVYAIFVFSLDIRIASIIYIVTTATLFLPNITGEKLATRKNRVLNENGLYVAKVNDLLSGHMLVNSQTENGFIKRHSVALEKLEDSRLSYGKYKSFVNVFNGSIMYVIDIAAFIAIAFFLVSGQITAGVATATITYIREFVAPLRGVIDSISAVKSVSGVKDQLFREIRQEKIVCKKHEFQKNIEFRNVCVKYDNFSLVNFSFTFEKGKKYAIVGESGSGKSTILKLLTKEIMLDSGKIYMDGVDTEEIDVLSMISYIEQNSYVFSEDFENNITIFGSYPMTNFKDTSSDEINPIVEAIIDKCNCSEASGGEKQILAIIRAYVAQKNIWILDEPCSAVDIVNERYIMQELLKQKELTIIMVTHNTSQENLKQFDNVIRLKNGVIVDVVKNE